MLLILVQDRDPLDRVSHIYTCCIWLWSDIPKANPSLYELSAWTIFFFLQILSLQNILSKSVGLSYPVINVCCFCIDNYMLSFIKEIQETCTLGGGEQPSSLYFGQTYWIFSSAYSTFWRKFSITRKRLTLFF